LRDRDQRDEVDARLDALPFEQVGEILGRDVARRARRERTAAEAADGGVEDACASLDRGEAVRVAGIARVVPVEAVGPRALDEGAHCGRPRDADRVGEDDLRSIREPPGELGDDVVGGVSVALRRWRWERRPTWVTWVPSTSSNLPERLAHRIGELGRLPVHPALVRARPGRPQSELANSTHRCSNVWPAFAVEPAGLPGGAVPGGPVLLVDDTYDSGWTVTVSAHRLREAGAEAVLPFVLARR